MDINVFAIRNPFIISEKIQPAFSQFTLQYDGVDLPIFVNDTAAEILRICDGTKSISDVYATLAQKYNEPVEEIEEKLHDFWEIALKANHIFLSKDPRLDGNKIVISGSKDYWTPDLLSVEITHNCPLKCRHCFLSAGCGKTMSLSVWRLISDSVVSMHIPQVQLTGGEPLLHPSFFDMMNEMLEAGVTVHVFTSGVVWSEELFERFKEYSKYRKKIVFQVSLDGMAEFHDHFRGVEGSFNRSIIFIRNIVSLGYKMSVGVTITNQTLDELIDLCKLCKEIGVSVVRIGAVSNRGRAEANEIGSKDSDIVNIGVIKTHLAELFTGDSFKVLLTEENSTNVTSYLMNCGLGQTSVKIDPAGNIYPCMMASTSYANINEESLLNVQKKFSRLFEKLNPPTKQSCNGCRNYHICNNCIVEGCLNSWNSCNWRKENYNNLKDCFMVSNNE